MTKLRVINVGPIEWFSPHFAFNDHNFVVKSYDPLKENQKLVDFCYDFNPDILLVFRGDLVRNQLEQLRHIYQIEFSSEIYPTNIFSAKRSESIAMSKFLHCMKNINPFSNVYHYDESRRGFLDIIGLNFNFSFLPVNTSCFDSINIKDIDLLFFGRASEKRKLCLDPLKELGLKFVWIENGLNWDELSSFISRSKVVVNITAEDIDNFEPRILLGLAGNACVITESSIGLDLFLSKNESYKDKVRIISPESKNIIDAYYYFASNDFFNEKIISIEDLSTNKFILSTFK